MNYKDQTPWNSPVPFCDHVAAPEVPLDVFPKEVRHLISEVAGTMQQPVGMVAVPAVAAFSAALGPKVLLKMKANGTWEEGANIWAARLAAPGSGKAPVMGAVVTPLTKLLDQHGGCWVDNFTVEALTVALENTNQGVFVWSD